MIDDRQLYAEGRIWFFEMKSDLKEIADEAALSATQYRSSSGLDKLAWYMQMNKMSVKHSIVAIAKEAQRIAVTASGNLMERPPSCQHREGKCWIFWLRMKCNLKEIADATLSAVTTMPEFMKRLPSSKHREKNT